MTWKPGDLLTLTTPRFELRTGTREDATEEFIGWLADPEVLVGLNLPRKRLTRPQAVRFILNNNNQTKFFLSIICRATNRMIGFYQVMIDPHNRIGETNVVIGDHSYWGKNVVIETRGRILDFLFDEMGVHKAIGRPHGRNVSSIFNYYAMGFTREAVLREQMLAIDGQRRLDLLVFGIFKEQWQAAKADLKT